MAKTCRQASKKRKTPGYLENWGHPSSFFRYEELKPKYKVFFQGFPVAMVTCYVTKMSASCSAIIGVSHDIRTLLLRDKVL